MCTRDAQDGDEVSKFKPKGSSDNPEAGKEAEEVKEP